VSLLTAGQNVKIVNFVKFSKVDVYTRAILFFQVKVQVRFSSFQVNFYTRHAIIFPNPRVKFSL